jgi:hypothetical protein
MAPCALSRRAAKVKNNSPADVMLLGLLPFMIEDSARSENITFMGEKNPGFSLYSLCGVCYNSTGKFGSEVLCPNLTLTGRKSEYGEVGTSPHELS